MTETTREEAEKTNPKISPKPSDFFAEFVHNVIVNDSGSIGGKIDIEIGQVRIKNGVHAAARNPTQSHEIQHLSRVIILRGAPPILTRSLERLGGGLIEESAFKAESFRSRNGF